MGRPLRILMISENFIDRIGGISHHVVKLSAALKRRGNPVHVLARVPRGYAVESAGLEGLDVTCVRIFSPAGLLDKARHLGFMLKGLGSLGRLLGEFRPDVAHFHGLWSDSVLAAGAKKAGGVGLVFTNHSSKFLEWHASPVKSRVLKTWLTEPDACISPSRELGEKYNELFGEVDTTYIPNGVDIEKFGGFGRKAEARRALGLPETGLIAVCPRRLCHKNGVHHLIGAIPRVPKGVRPLFIIAGDGPMRHELEGLAGRLGVSGDVRFMGSVPYARMPAVYAASDMSVMPSLMEAVSLAALEAMAGGLPVVASAVGGLKDLLDGTGAGVLVPPADHARLAEAITGLAVDEGARRGAGAAARRLSREYSWDEIARRTEDVYRHVLAGVPGGLA